MGNAEYLAPVFLRS